VAVTKLYIQSALQSDVIFHTVASIGLKEISPRPQVSQTCGQDITKMIVKRQIKKYKVQSRNFV
jgi:hypothetical protein